MANLEFTHAQREFQLKFVCINQLKCSIANTIRRYHHNHCRTINMCVYTIRWPSIPGTTQINRGRQWSFGVAFL